MVNNVEYDKINDCMKKNHVCIGATWGNVGNKLQMFQGWKVGRLERGVGPRSKHYVQCRYSGVRNG